MNNKKLFVKIVFIALIVLLLFALVAPAIFSQTALPAPKRENLLNGLKVLMWSDAKADKVTIQIRIHAGSAFDPQTKEGVMQLLADNIFPNEAAKEFFTDDLGGGLEIITNYDFIQVNASSKPEHFLAMLETLSTAVSNPAIDKETTIRLRTALIAKVRTLEAEPAYIADQAVARRLFGSFPYGRPQLGSEGSLKTIDFADLLDAKQRFLTADNATIAVSGNFDKALGFRAIRRYFGGWLKSDKRVPSTFRQPDEPLSELLRIPSPNPEKAAIRFAIRGVARSDKALAASMVFTKIMENRGKSRVPAEHSADAFVRNEAYTLPGIVTIGFFVKHDYDGKENGKIIGFDLRDLITENEFQAAKNAIIAEWGRKETAAFWLDADTYKLADPVAYSRSAEMVTLADVNAYAEKTRKVPVAAVLVSTPPKSN